MSALTYSKASQNWFFKYKLYHIPFWLAYHYTWWVITLGSPAKVNSTIVILPFAIKFCFYLVFQAVAAYINIYYLIPKYLEKSRFAAYIVRLLITIGVATLLVISGYYFSSFLTGRSLAELYGGGSEADCFMRFLGNALPSTVASTTLVMSIKLAKNWIQTKSREKELEKEKLETELKFLKNQFNPHFLFNTINSIFFLIHKNADQASDALAKFSELLRYQLYECNDLQIPLTKELSYMSNFIELEKLRQNDNVLINVESDTNSGANLGIAPFILMVFVENAFKHVSKNSDEINWIKICTTLRENELKFVISNSVSPITKTDVVHYGGIGLANVQRRLDLVYPAQHELQIQKSDTRFEVRLSVELSELTVQQRIEVAV